MQLLVEADMDAQQVTGTATAAQWKLCRGSVKHSTAISQLVVLQGWPSAHVQCHTPRVSLVSCLCLELAAHQPGTAMPCHLAIPTALAQWQC